MAFPPPPKLVYIALYNILGAFGRRSPGLEPANLSRKELILRGVRITQRTLVEADSLCCSPHTHTQTVVCACVCFQDEKKKDLLCLSETQNMISFSAVRVIFIQNVQTEQQV